jgi:CRP/FNR family transcriptional regulator, anaerobic regulatory protein
MEIREASERGTRLLMEAAVGSTVAHKGTVLLEDERKGDVLVLQSGWTIRTQELGDGRRAILDVYLPGDLLGCDAVMGTPVGVVVAITEVSFCRVDAVEVSRLIDNPDVARSLWKACAKEQARVDLLAAMLARGNAAERLASLVLHLHQRLQRRQLARDGRFRLGMTQQEIGDHLGLTVVHINRVLRSLRERGVMSIARGAVSMNVEGLRTVAGPFSPGVWRGVHGRGERPVRSFGASRDDGGGISAP